MIKSIIITFKNEVSSFKITSCYNHKSILPHGINTITLGFSFVYGKKKALSDLSVSKTTHQRQFP